MVVVWAPATDKICEAFTHNPLMRAQGNTNFLYLMGTQKEFIAYVSEFDSDFGGGKHVYVCVATGDHN